MRKRIRMIIEEPTFRIDAEETDQFKDKIYKKIANAARTCYQSGSMANERNDAKLIHNLIQHQHEAMLEHASITVTFKVDRGITHELVRHRLASFAQESSRYCNYNKEKFGNAITYIDIRNAVEIDPATKKMDTKAKMYLINEWIKACSDAEKHYMRMLELGCSPQIARSVLNNSTKSEIVVTANIREWRHILKLRAVGTTGAPHPQMVEIMQPLLKKFKSMLPDLFFDLNIPE